jgi:uncharacterized protein YneF (UPF0154 family)
MSNWILVGPLVGLILIICGLILGFVIFPPLIEKTIEEVR